MAALLARANLQPRGSPCAQQQQAGAGGKALQEQPVLDCLQLLLGTLATACSARCGRGGGRCVTCCEPHAMLGGTCPCEMEW